ncbi:unnamed protein product [Cyclocybe aegerita]|uniref:PARG catalytic Macro domain-containing protein n=1 Tax=Cyclocybe aegerita TaxID=1973307 RepID=A0A8S0WC96_CYCAE|nr:unnamed protein product [Cyclocybe aegerita]
MEVPADAYILPSHLSKVCLDPLGLCDVENPPVWDVIETSIHVFRSECPPPNIHQLPRLIEDLSYSIHLDGHINTQYLSHFLAERYPDPSSPLAQTTLDAILDAALALPKLFTAHTMCHLGEGHPICELSVAQIQCILAHQILNTLVRPKGNNWGCGFSGWYSEPQALETAVSGYLTALFKYFAQSPIHDATSVTYQYYSQASGTNLESQVDDWMKCSTIQLFDTLTIEPVSSSGVPFPHPSAPSTLVASNKFPGFGPSCTQEELVTAACPPLLLLGAILVNPPVPSNAALLVYGPVPLTHWQGQGREARRTGATITKHHTFLFLDAAELDTSNKIYPDLDLRCILRDLQKLYLGFTALRQQGVMEAASPLWGAGSFGGDPFINTLILAMASARVGLKLHLSVDKERRYSSATSASTEKAQHLLSLLQTLRGRNSLTIGNTVHRLRCLAKAVKTHPEGGVDIVDAFDSDVM